MQAFANFTNIQAAIKCIEALKVCAVPCLLYTSDAADE